MKMKNRPDFEKKELAYSSAPYVYLPMEMPVYAVEITHREQIDGDLLQKALERTLKRMPYLSDTLTEDHGQIWYAKNPLPMEAAHTSALRRIGGSETNYHLLDLTWDGNVTWFSMFHGFCDGQGINAFLESVLYHYYCMKDGTEYDPAGIRTDKTEMSEAETLDPQAHPYEVSPDYVPPERKEQPAAYHLPECVPVMNTEIRSYGLRVASDELMSFVRANGTSPAVALSMLTGEAILRVHPEADAPVFALIPVSIRRMLGMEETFKNCSGRAVLPMSGTPMDAMPFSSRAAALRGLLKQQMNPDLYRFQYNWMGDINRRRMGQAVSYAEEIKKPAGFLTLSHDTFYLDYIGSLHPTGYSGQITDVRFLCIPGGRTMQLNVIEHNGQFRIDCLGQADLSAYAESLAGIAQEHGLHVQTAPEYRVTLPLTAWREDM